MAPKHEFRQLAKKFAAEARAQKSGLLLTRKVLEIFVGTPRTPAAPKGKVSKDRKAMKPSKTPTPVTTKKTLKAPQSVAKATSIQNETFTLV